MRMLKKMSSLLLAFCMLLTLALPTNVYAGGEDIINSYDALKAALESNVEDDFMDIYIEPTGFIWPEEESALSITSNIVMDSGTWNIPKNITLEFSSTSSPAKITAYTAAELEIEGKVIINSDHNLQGVDITLEKDGCIESPNNTTLYVGSSYTFTLKDGAVMSLPIRLDGTLTGSGSVLKRVAVSGGYSGSDSNAVISGNVKCMDVVEVEKSSSSEYNASLTIPSDSNVEITGLRVSNGTVNLNGNLAISDTYNQICDGGKMVMNNGKLTIKPNASLNYNYGSEIGKMILGTGSIYLEANKDADGYDTDIPSIFYNRADVIEKPAVVKNLSNYIDEGITITSNCCQHNWNYEITKPATYEETGEMIGTCAECGKTITEILRKLEPETAETEIPNTETPETQIPETEAPKVPVKGTVITDSKSKGKYTISSVSESNPTVTYKGVVDKKVKTITIPTSVTVDGITYKVTAIANNAFKNNKKVTKVTISSSVTKIGKNAFSGCSKLKTLTIKSTKLTAKTVAKNAFKGLTKKTTIKVPKKKLIAYKKLFKSKGLSAKVAVKK
ncbi:MAG: leucine-rich repeat protein [Lachnospiraceae bacterium]|nr:leucine-rich repeat protein [Lachnospiraceae bacterium]